jgi:hypothetical protein
MRFRSRASARSITISPIRRRLVWRSDSRPFGGNLGGTILLVCASDRWSELPKVSVLAAQGMCGVFADWLAWPDKEEVRGSSPRRPTQRYSRFTGPRFTFGLGAGLLAASAASSCCKRESVHNAVGVARLTCRSFGGQRPLPQVKTKREHLTQVGPYIAVRHFKVRYTYFLFQLRTRATPSRTESARRSGPGGSCMEIRSETICLAR